MKGKVVVDVVVVNGGFWNLSLELAEDDDGNVLRNDSATWHVISTPLPNL